MSTPTPPTARRGAGRSKAKARRTKPYDDATRSKAVEQLAADGMAATHKATGIPKPTLGRWAKAAGIDFGEQARTIEQHAGAATRARSAVVRLSTIDVLEHHIAQAGEFLSTVAGVNALAAQLIAGGDPDRISTAVGMAGPYAVLEPGSDAAELHKVALALDGLPLAVRDAEGILTRAVHDLQLLRGEATERGELVVEFNVPRPTPSTTAVVEQPRPIE